MSRLVVLPCLIILYSVLFSCKTLSTQKASANNQLKSVAVQNIGPDTVMLPELKYLKDIICLKMQSYHEGDTLSQRVAIDVQSYSNIRDSPEIDGTLNLKYPYKLGKGDSCSYYILECNVDLQLPDEFVWILFVGTDQYVFECSNRKCVIQ